MKRSSEWDYEFCKMGNCVDQGISWKIKLLEENNPLKGGRAEFEVFGRNRFNLKRGFIDIRADNDVFKIDAQVIVPVPGPGPVETPIDLKINSDLRNKQLTIELLQDSHLLGRGDNFKFNGTLNANDTINVVFDFKGKQLKFRAGWNSQEHFWIDSELDNGGRTNLLGAWWDWRLKYFKVRVGDYYFRRELVIKQMVNHSNVEFSLIMKVIAANMIESDGIKIVVSKEGNKQHDVRMRFETNDVEIASAKLKQTLMIEPSLSADFLLEAELSGKESDLFQWYHRMSTPFRDGVYTFSTYHISTLEKTLAVYRVKLQVSMRSWEWTRQISTLFLITKNASAWMRINHEFELDQHHDYSLDMTSQVRLSSDTPIYNFCKQTLYNLNCSSWEMIDVNLFLKDKNFKNVYSSVYVRRNNEPFYELYLTPKSASTYRLEIFSPESLRTAYWDRKPSTAFDIEMEYIASSFNMTMTNEKDNQVIRIEKKSDRNIEISRNGIEVLELLIMGGDQNSLLVNSLALPDGRYAMLQIKGGFDKFQKSDLVVYIGNAEATVDLEVNGSNVKASVGYLQDCNANTPGKSRPIVHPCKIFKSHKDAAMNFSIELDTRTGARSALLTLEADKTEQLRLDFLHENVMPSLLQVAKRVVEHVQEQPWPEEFISHSYYYMKYKFVHKIRRFLCHFSIC